jgi:oligopeptide transport system permease protein
MRKKFDMFPERPGDVFGGGVPDDLFEPLPAGTRETDVINRESLSYWGQARAKMASDPLAMAGLVVIALMILLAALGPVIRPFPYDEQNYSVINQTPNAEHWFGTDKFGRDLFVRVAYGARISLAVGVVAAFINVTIGVIYGGISGYFGGTADMIMMRIVDIMDTIPTLLYMIIVMIFLGSNVRSIITALCLSYWLNTSRMVRAQVMSIKRQDFVMAARVAGESGWRILTRHLIPNSIGPIIVMVTFLIPQAIFYEAFLSFIGIGISVPVASWGTLANDSLANMNMYPHLTVFPLAAISVTIFAFNFVGDGLRDALDPRLKR